MNDHMAPAGRSSTTGPDYSRLYAGRCLDPHPEDPNARCTRHPHTDPSHEYRSGSHRPPTRTWTSPVPGARATLAGDVDPTHVAPYGPALGQLPPPRRCACGLRIWPGRSLWDGPVWRGSAWVDSLGYETHDDGHHAPMHGSGVSAEESERIVNDQTPSSTPEPDPLTVRCPRCESYPGHACVKGARGVQTATHTERVHALRDARPDLVLDEMGDLLIALRCSMRRAQLLNPLSSEDPEPIGDDTRAVSKGVPHARWTLMGGVQVRHEHGETVTVRVRPPASPSTLAAEAAGLLTGLPSSDRVWGRDELRSVRDFLARVAGVQNTR